MKKDAQRKYLLDRCVSQRRAAFNGNDRRFGVLAGGDVGDQFGFLGGFNIGRVLGGASCNQ